MHGNSDIKCRKYVWRFQFYCFSKCVRVLLGGFSKLENHLPYAHTFFVFVDTKISIPPSKSKTVLWQGHEFSVCAHVCRPPHPRLLNFWTTELTFTKPCMKITPLESTPSATFWNYTVSNTNSVKAQTYEVGRQQDLIPQSH